MDVNKNTLAFYETEVFIYIYNRGLSGANKIVIFSINANP